MKVGYDIQGLSQHSGGVMSNNRAFPRCILVLVVALVGVSSASWISPHATRAAATYPDAVAKLVEADSQSACDRLGWMWSDTGELAKSRNHFSACVGEMSLSASCYDDTQAGHKVDEPSKGQRWLYCHVYIESPKGSDITVQNDEFGVIDSSNKKYGWDKANALSAVAAIGAAVRDEIHIIQKGTREHILLAFAVLDTASVPFALEYAFGPTLDSKLYIVLDLPALAENTGHATPTATVMPTTVATATLAAPTKAPTPPPIPTATAFNVEPLNFQEEFYFQTMYQSLKMVAAGIELLQQGGQVNRLTAASQWHAAYLFVLQMSVPTRMQGIHMALKDATSHFDKAATLMDEAFIYGQPLDEAAWELEVTAGYNGLLAIDDEIDELEVLTGEDLPHLAS